MRSTGADFANFTDAQNLGSGVGVDDLDIRQGQGGSDRPDLERAAFAHIGQHRPSLGLPEAFEDRGAGASFPLPQRFLGQRCGARIGAAQ